MPGSKGEKLLDKVGFRPTAGEGALFWGGGRNPMRRVKVIGPGNPNYYGRGWYRVEWVDDEVPSQSTVYALYLYPQTHANMIVWVGRAPWTIVMDENGIKEEFAALYREARSSEEVKG